MIRAHPFLSPLGALLSLALLVGLAVALRLKGGLAFSPGSLSAQSRPGLRLGGFASHADLEKECKRCHQPLQTAQAALCLECHQGVRQEIEAQSALHGQIAGVQRCVLCHADHRGRDYDLNQEALAHFDHSLARFDLIWHQVNYDATPMACEACHVRGSQGFAFSAASCADCHAGKDPAFLRQHVQDFGEGCLECHDGLDTLARFDHAATGFPLTEKHAALRCVACHSPERRSAAVSQPVPARGLFPPGHPFQPIASECVACHAEPDLHRGVFDQDCAACHRTAGWRPASLDGASFDHETDAGFSLKRHARDYAGNAISCTACHSGGVRSFQPADCAACHTEHDAAFMAGHTEKYGPACQDCHDGVDRMRNFDHARLFPLDGRHAEIGCQDCHAGFKFRGTPRACVECHAEPQIHAGFFGLKCESCHTTQAWTPAFLRFHNFPLDHGSQGQVSCQTCHPSNYVEYTCYGCHEHQPDPMATQHARLDLTPAELLACARCHPDGKK